MNRFALIPARGVCRLALRAAVANWSLTSLQQRLLKTGGRLIKHARYYWLLLAESHLTRRLFGGMLRRIATVRRQRDKVKLPPFLAWVSCRFCVRP